MYKRKNISKSIETYSKLRRNNKFKKYSENIKSRNYSCKNNNSKIKEAIHLEVINLIKENMINIESKFTNICTSNNSRTFDEDNFKNYSGEKISIFSYCQNDKTDESFSNWQQKTVNNTQVIKNNIKYKKKFQYIFNVQKKNVIKKNRFSRKKLVSKINKINNNNNNCLDTNKDKETLVNSSYIGRINNSSMENDCIEKEKEKEKEKQEILSYFERNLEKNFNNQHSYDRTKKYIMKANSAQISNQKVKSCFKEVKNSVHNNFSLYESTSTSNTYEKNKLKFHQSDAKYFKKNEEELIHFFDEINLPLNYAKKFIENGFDDLNIILNLTKTHIAISNQNLKDIGILNASHRAKILIHLEEKAEIIPYHLERSIIYNKNDSNSSNKIMGEKLSKFFDEINCEKYLNNFKLNGYFNIELLLTQMFIKQPINSEILKEDFYIDDEPSRNRIVNKLEIESRKYMKRLQKRNINKNNINDNTIITNEDNMFHNPCEYCLIF